GTRTAGGDALARRPRRGAPRAPRGAPRDGTPKPDPRAPRGHRPSDRGGRGVRRAHRPARPSRAARPRARLRPSTDRSTAPVRVRGAAGVCQTRVSEAWGPDGEEEVADDEEDGETRDEEAGQEDTEARREEGGAVRVHRVEGDGPAALLGTGALLGTLIRDERAHEPRDLGRVLLVEEELRVRQRVEPGDVRKLRQHGAGTRLRERRVVRAPDEERRHGELAVEPRALVEPREVHLAQEAHRAVHPPRSVQQRLDEARVKLAVDVPPIVEAAAEAERRAAKRRQLQQLREDERRSGQAR